MSRVTGLPVRLAIGLTALASGIAVPVPAIAGTTAAAHAGMGDGLFGRRGKSDARTISWDDLLPEGEEDVLDQLYDTYYRKLDGSVDAVEEGSDLDAMPQLGTFRAVEALDGQRVRLPGYMVPLDTDDRGRLTVFLLVPYFGACLHSPPPPPNQIVYVEGKTKMTGDDIWMPVWAEGTLSVGRADSALGNAAYTLTLDRLDPYED